MFKPGQILRKFERKLSNPQGLARAMVTGVLGTASLRAGYAAIGFVISIVLARTLGPSGYGTYAFVMALVAFMSIPSELGIPGLAVREIAVTKARHEWGRMRGFIQWAHRATGMFSIVLIALGSAALLIYGDRIDPVKRQCTWLGMLLVPLVSLGSLRGAMLRGLRKVVLGQLPEQIIRPLVFLILILGYILIDQSQKSAVDIMAFQNVATAVAFCSGLYLFLKYRPAELSTAEARLETSTWFKSSIPFGMSAALRLINGRTDILVLGAFHSDADVGVYRVAVQLATFVAFGLQVVNPIQGPHLAHLFATGDMKRLQELVTQTSRVILFVTLPVVVAMILLGPFIIDRAFGDKYRAAYLPLVILCAGQLVNAAMGSVASVLNMTGHERDTTASILIGAIVNLTLNFTLTPTMGMTGAAIATTATLIVWNLIMWQKVYKRIGIEASPFLRRRR